MSQLGVVKRLLEERGAVGVETHELVYGYGITRAAAIVHELRHTYGMNIVTIDNGETEAGQQKLATYVLKPKDAIWCPILLAKVDVANCTVDQCGAPENIPVCALPHRESAAQPDPALGHLVLCGCVRTVEGRWVSRCDAHLLRGWL